jgi:hypothetical protein
MWRGERHDTRNPPLPLGVQVAMAETSGAAGGRTGRAALGVVMLLVLLAACADTWSPGSSAVQPLAKADGWRDGLVDHFDGNEPFGLVEIAYDRATAERAWADNVPEALPERSARPEDPGRYGGLDDIDFASHALVVWSSGQSGSCPEWLADVRTRDDGGIEVRTRQRGGACTDDYNRYRMVLAVSLSRLPGVEALPTSDVVVDGHTSGWQSLAVPYPSG